MGSGYSDLYQNTIGALNELADNNAPAADKSGKAEFKSQPFAADYGVMPDMLNLDKRRAVYSEESGYIKNPTAVNAYESIQNGILIDHAGKPMDGHYTYAVDLNDRLIIGKRNGNDRDSIATPHPTLIGGKEPRVKVAGMVTISNGKVVQYDNMSGHFKPNILSMPEANKAFSRLPATAIHRNFKKHMNRRS